LQIASNSTVGSNDPTCASQVLKQGR